MKINKKVVLMLLGSIATIGIAQATGKSSNPPNGTDGVFDVAYKTATGTPGNIVSGAGMSLNGVYGPVGSLIGGKWETPSDGVGNTVAIAAPINYFGINNNTGTSGGAIWEMTGPALTTTFQNLAPPSSITFNHAGLFVPDSNLTIGRVNGTVGLPVLPMPPMGSILTDDGVYFGVWDRKAGDAVFPNNYDSTGTPAGSAPVTFGEANAVFFSGPKTTGYTPGTGVVDYDVTSLTKGATHTAALVGQTNGSTAKFTANFGTNLLDGKTVDSSNVVLLEIVNAKIGSNGEIFNDVTAGTTAKFKGTDSGTVTGQFYGANATKLAGIVEFSDINNNTAFGGQ